MFDFVTQTIVAFFIGFITRDWNICIGSRFALLCYKKNGVIKARLGGIGWKKDGK